MQIQIPIKYVYPFNEPFVKPFVDKPYKPWETPVEKQNDDKNNCFDILVDESPFKKLHKGSINGVKFTVSFDEKTPIKVFDANTSVSKNNICLIFSIPILYHSKNEINATYNKDENKINISFVDTSINNILYKGQKSSYGEIPSFKNATIHIPTKKFTVEKIELVNGLLNITVDMIIKNQETILDIL
jgi:hypothetical protein